jgi:hypothetical protein
MATPRRALNQWNSMTPLDTASEWHMNTLARIYQLAQLPVNWDGYGSPKIQGAARENAARLVALLALSEPPTPHIAPVPGGGIQLEWVCENRELEFEILPDGKLEFLATLETGEMLESPLSDWNKQVPYLIKWLIAGEV